MQFLAAPTDHAAGVPIWCAPDAIEKTPLGLLGIRISICHLAIGFGQGRIFAIRHFHAIQSFTEIRGLLIEYDEPGALIPREGANVIEVQRVGAAVLQCELEFDVGSQHQNPPRTDGCDGGISQSEAVE